MDELLHYDTNNVKALYLRGKALMSKNQLTLALRDFEQAS